MKVVAVGHSHISGLIAAQDALVERGEAKFDLHSVHLVRDFKPSCVQVDGVRHFTPEVVQAILSLVETERPDAMLLLLQGNTAATIGLRNRLFDFFEPSGDTTGVDEALPILAYDLVVDYFESNYGMTDRFLGGNLAALPARRIAVSHPPLVGDADFLLKQLEATSVYAAIKARGIPPAAFRARLWRASMTAARGVYGRHDTGFLPPPEQVYASDGCLAADYRLDAVHANPSYYSLVIDQIAATLRTH